MDDMFFSNNNSKRKNNDRRKVPNDFIYDDGFKDEYSNEPKRNSEKRFTVRIPQNEQPQLDRRPKGRPVASNEEGIRTSRVMPNLEMPEYIPADIDRDIYSSSQPRKEYESSVQKQTQVRKTQNSNQQKRNAQNFKQKKKKNGKTKAVVAVICVLTICFLTVFGYGWFMLGKISYDKDFKDDNAYMSESKLKKSSSVKNILFLGSDARGEIQGQRSDTMILFSIDKKNHKIKMTSFLRDSYVYIPSEGYKTRLNHAFSYGGPQLLIDTMEYNFGIKIDGYVLIDFEGFKKLIDLMGGLDIDGVTAAEAKYMREVVKAKTIKEGKNHMTGGATLWYCRIRYLDNDFRRTERQRKVISAIINQMLHTSPAKLVKIIEEVLPMIETSMDRNEVIPTAMSAIVNFIGSDNPQHQIPTEGTWSNQRVSGMDVLVMDIDENSKLLTDFLYKKDSKKDK